MGVESNQWAVERCGMMLDAAERCGGAALTAWEVREVVKYDTGWFTSCRHADGGLCHSIRRSPVFDLWEWAMKHDFQLVISEATAFRRMSGRPAANTFTKAQHGQSGLWLKIASHADMSKVRTAHPELRLKMYADDIKVHVWRYQRTTEAIEEGR